MRRHAFHSLAPDLGPLKPNPERGASADRRATLLVAWNLWVRGITLGEANVVAKALRRSEVRALAFEMPDDFVQISFNLIDPLKVTPSMVYDEAADLLSGGAIEHAELVGSIPEAVLAARRPEALDAARTEQEPTTIEKSSRSVQPA